MTTLTLPANGGRLAPSFAPTGTCLRLDAAQMRNDFNRKPFLVGHNLLGHPLFTLPRLIELARRLPESFVEYYAGNVPVSVDWEKTPRNGLSVEETIRRVEECCSWMVLKRVEQDPEYKEFLDAVLDEVQAHSEPLDPGMFDRAGAVFISSPGAVTPYHMDEEHNFLLQLRGSKTIRVYPGADRALLSEEELEAHFTRPTIDRNLVFREEYDRKAAVFELTAGHALHVPTLDPHWVQNGPAVSISFSAGFMTRRSERRRMIHRVNHRLRRLGLKPTPYGQSPLCDGLKAAAARAGARLGELWPRPSERGV